MDDKQFGDSIVRVLRKHAEEIRTPKVMTNKEKAKLLRSAASALEHGRYATAKKKVLVAFNELFPVIEKEHPDTDWHRSGCPECQYEYDKHLPDYQGE